MSMLWQRFTERAKRVVIAAQEAAAHAGEPYVSPEHLLIGLLSETDSVAIRVLELLGVAAVRVRQEIERQIVPRGYGRLSNNDVSLDPRMKRVLDFAYDEARQLHTNYIGTEHLLLGIVREGEGIGFRTLAKLGVDIVAVRKEVAKYIGKTDVPATTTDAPATTPVAQSHPTRRVDHAVAKFDDPKKARSWLNLTINAGYELSKIAAANGELWIIATATTTLPPVATPTEMDDTAAADDTAAGDDTAATEHTATPDDTTAAEPTGDESIEHGDEEEGV